MKIRDIIKILESHGWEQVRMNVVTGSSVIRIGQVLDPCINLPLSVSSSR